MLRLHHQGVSNRKIVEQIGIYKGTVNRIFKSLSFSTTLLMTF